MTLEILLVGLGRQGSRHARVLQSMQGVTISATVDPRSEGLPGVPHFAELAGALERGSYSGAVVAGPSSEHGRLVCQLIDHGVPSLVEKPFASTALEASRLRELASRAGVPLHVGHVERFNPAVSLVRAMLEAGRLGTPIAMSFRRVGLPPPGGITTSVVQDLGVHDIDVFASLMGCAEFVSANGWPTTPLSESAHVLLRSGNVHGLVEVNWRTPVRLRGFTITTDSCYVEADYTSQRVEVVEASDPAEFVDFKAFQSHYGSARKSVLETTPAEPLREQDAAWIASLHGGDAGPLATAEEGANAVAIAETAVQAIVRG